MPIPRSSRPTAMGRAAVTVAQTVATFSIVIIAAGFMAAERTAAAQEPESAHVVPANPAPPPPQPAPPPKQEAPQKAPPPQQPAPPPQQEAPQEQPAPPPPPPQPAEPAPQPQITPAPQPAPAAPPRQAAPAARPAPATPKASAAAPASPGSAASSGSPAFSQPGSPARQRSAAPPAGRQAESAQQTPTPLFGEQIEVRVVNVEAVVTDKRGNRVPDLKPEDFRLKVDGKTIKIDYFNEVRGGQAIAPEAGVKQTIPGLPDLAPGSPVGTSYLVFVDDYFSLGPRRDEVLRSLKNDLTRLGPEDRMALVAFDGRHVTMLSSWSSSAHDLGRAIDRELGNPTHGLERFAELRNFRLTEGTDDRAPDLVERIHGGFSRTQLNVPERAYVEELGQQVERAVDAAVSTLRGFATPPGRKVMLLLSGGWPFSPADYAVNDINRPITERDVPNGEALLRPLVETANRLGYTLYPIDVPGVETETTDASTNTSPSLNDSFGLREQEHEGTLVYLAKETGGRALLNSLRIASLEHVEADTRSYYWLGFTPSWQGNDKHHSIQLGVLRPGLSVRARDSFLDRSRKSEISMMVESAMLFGNPPGAPTMPVQLGKPVKTGRHEMEVAVVMAIPADSFVTVPLNGKYASELELRIAALDERGQKADIPVVPLQLQSAKEPQKGQYIRIQTKLKLRRIAQHVVFAIFDPLSNKVTTGEADVKPD